MVGDIPRGIEVLVKKAAVDPTFKKLLLEKRAEAAAAIGLKLTAAEEAMLQNIPEAQLAGTVASTKVHPRLRPVFTGYAAGVMLAVLGAATAACDGPLDSSMGSRPDFPRKYPPSDVAPENESVAQSVKRGAAETPLTDKAPSEPSTEEDR
jgi:hypothetical protein